MINNFILTLIECHRIFLFMIYVNGFQKKSFSVTTSPEAESYAMTVQGESMGLAISKKIGKEGGKVELPDKEISLIVPPGAVQEETIFGIEMITNTNPASVGAAYRLTPASLNLSVPVLVQLSLEKIQDEISFPDALAIAYQTQYGYWNMLDSKIDGKNGHLSVLTTNLGDFGPMQWLMLKPANATVFVGESKDLEVIRYIAAPADKDDFLSVPLIPKRERQDIPVLNPIALENKYIKKWRFDDGPGTLIPYRSKAKYTAFSSVLTGNTATVSIELKTKSDKVSLVSTLQIANDIYLKIRVNDRQTITLNAVANYKDDSKEVFSISGALPNHNTEIPFVITGKTKKGSYSWNDKNTGEKKESAATLNYIHPSEAFYVEWCESNIDNLTAMNQGCLQILEIGKDGEYLIGKFSASRARFYDAANKYISEGTLKVQGEFKVLLLDKGNGMPKEKGKVYSKIKLALERKLMALYREILRKRSI